MNASDSDIRLPDHIVHGSMDPYEKQQLVEGFIRLSADQRRHALVTCFNRQSGGIYRLETGNPYHYQQLQECLADG